MDRFVLESEGMPPVEAPVWADVESILRKLGPSGPGFVTLSHSRRGYVQAAGARLRMIIECREIADDGSFSHFVVGKPAEETRETSINTAAGTIRLRSNEVLGATTAIEVFRHFYAGEPIPETYTRRNVTRMFKTD